MGVILFTVSMEALENTFHLSQSRKIKRKRKTERRNARVTETAIETFIEIETETETGRFQFRHI